MHSPLEKIRRTLNYHYFRRKNGWNFPTNMAHLTGGKMALGTYEPEVSRIVAQYLKPGSTFVDVGANVGYFARLASDIIGKRGSVYAFEVEPENYFILTKNVNDFKNITPLNFAVSESNTFLSINHSSHSSCHSIVATDNHLDGSQFRVPTISMDHFWREYLNSGPIDLMKIDVEGAELLVLRGMSELLSQEAFGTIIIEYCPRIILNAGFKLQNFYELLASNFSISIIEEEHKSVLDRGEIKDSAHFKKITAHLLDLDGAVNINLLCRKN